MKCCQDNSGEVTLRIPTCTSPPADKEVCLEVEAYMPKSLPFPEPDDPVQVLEYYMESRGLSRTDLIAYLGSKKHVLEVLNHKWELTFKMIQQLHTGLGIPADLLVVNRLRKLRQPKNQGPSRLYRYRFAR